MASNSRFGHIDIAPPIEVFALIAEYNKDEYPDKVNVSVGAYRTKEGKPWVLPVVRTVEAQMASDQTLNHEYLPVAGLPSFREAACRLILGSEDVDYTRIGGVQALGGTGGIRLCADFTKKFLGCDTVYVSKPTWGNHKGVFKAAGFSNIVEYRYWKAETCSLDIDGMLQDLEGAPPNSVVILHAVAHNPTGVDPTPDQWETIADLCERKNMFVLMDCAYQGFSTGDLDKDAYSCRLFYKKGFEFFIAQSFSKNFGLYNERVGNLCVIAKDSESKVKVLSQLELIVRTTYSNPGNHGARVVATVLNNPALNGEWKENIRTMAGRILGMRDLLHQKLKAIGCPGNWDHIIQQKGMFSYTGLNEQQCEKLKKDYHIYIMKSGRINMCGLTPTNMDYVVNAIFTVVSGKQDSKI
ncbi:aspartate aminotransferase, cytoplasmic-like [Ruditapes philippinarum]|uniref:aspartate aminotransferase, cytoplasmic-like n=1 Tax=Ruditapes philippinarum TaxID=129788 RepID=UPI00295A8C28|nr:aspartate aminotransferase, cytoplasmic-like [Ruditapes philippinarum]